MKRTILATSLVASLATGTTLAEPARQAEAIPQWDHAFVIIMENHFYPEIIGNQNAPFITEYARSVNQATNYFAVGHPSLPNYLEAMGGSNFGVTADNFPNWHGLQAPTSTLVNPIAGPGTDVATPSTFPAQGYTVPRSYALRNYPAARFTPMTIADQLVQNGRSWKTYQQSLPLTGPDDVNFADGFYSNISDFTDVAAALGCTTDSSQAGWCGNKVQRLYAVKHDPFVYFSQVQSGEDPRNSFKNVTGFDGATGLYAELASGRAPDFSLIVPDQCNDMHGAAGGTVFCNADASAVQQGDQAVERLIKAIHHSEAWKRGRNVIVVFWDENDFSDNANRVPFLVETSYGARHVVSSRAYDHFSLLRTLEAGFHLPCLNHACDSTSAVMTDLFGDDRP